MFRLRLLVRCLLACVLALLGLLGASVLPFKPSALPRSAVAAGRSAEITSTASIDLSTSNGTFIDTLVSLPGVQYGSASWGDCNNDGASDVLLTGQVSDSLKIARVYQQQIDGSFRLAADLTGVYHGAAAWGDYDNDGWLDIVVTGESANGSPVSQLYHNERVEKTCTFSAVATNLAGVSYSTAAWGDYDADGQLDLLLAGYNGSQPVTRLYRNDHGSLVDSGLSLPGIQNGTAAWGDYDGDGQVDLLLTGSAAGNVPLTTIYHNDGHGGLNPIQAALPALRDSAAAWGDYDNDGQLDLLLEGTTDSGMAVAEIYRNDHGVFVKNAASQLEGGLFWTGAAWGDFDTDGYLDALISSSGSATAYRNEITGSFAAGIKVGASALTGATVAWGHYDNTVRDLEVLLTGQSLAGRITKIYWYSNRVPNAPPDPPGNLTATIEGSNATLFWSPPITDDHTPLAGLSYNLRMGTRPGGVDIVAPMALTETGYRLLPALGNMYSSLSVTLRSLPLGRPLYWSVQAIDTSFIGSNFAAEGEFQIPYRVFLPLALKDEVSYYTDEWETEPNNTSQQANGPLISGHTYRGLHDDEKDYYSVYLPDSGTLNVDMDSPNGGTQIQLFYQVADVAHRVGFDPTPPYHIGYTGASGWYYIYVYTNPAFVGTQVYTLTATY